MRRALLTAGAVLLVTTASLAAAADPAGSGTTSGARYVDPIFGVQVTSDIVYGQNTAVDGTGVVEQLELDLYQPVDDAAALRPVVVLAHGGGFCGGDKSSGRMVQQANHLTARGWVTASTNYRVDPRQCDTIAALVAAAEDGRAAVRWFRAHADELRIDPTRIAFLGYRRCMADHAGFADVPLGSAGDLEPAAGWMDEWGITTGYPDGRFKPANQVTRHQMASFLFRLAGSPVVEDPPRFPDVPPSASYTDAVSWLASTGITTGYPDGTFRPTTLLNRHQLASFLWRAVGEPEAPPASFPDVAADTPYADAVAWLSSTGITTGYVDGTFRPSVVVNRLQVAQMLWRLGRTDVDEDGPLGTPVGACANADLVR